MFGEQEGHLLLISNVLYGLKSSGSRFNEILAKHLTSLGFIRLECEANIWYWRSSCATRYKYVVMYVNDLCAALMEVFKLVEQL